MSLDKKLFKAASTTTTDTAEGLVLHLDANDEDSIEQGGANDGNTNGTWFDIANHDLNVPLVDKASNLKVHLNASDTTSYGGSGTTWSDISGSGLHATTSGASFGSDTRGYFDFSGAASDLITIPDSPFVDMESNSTMEVWLQKPTTTCHIINKGAGDGNESYALWASSSVIYFYRYQTDGNSTTALNISTSSIATDEYMHVAITVGSSGDFKMYLNGGSQVSASISSYRDNSNSVRIGNYNTSNQHPYTERLSVVRFYNTALTASEVAQNYRANSFLSYSSTYDTGLALHFDATDIDTSANTWTDKVASLVLTKSGSSSYDKELGDYVELEGGYYGNDSAAVQIKNSDQDFTVEYFGQHVFGASNAILGIEQGTIIGYILAYTSSDYFLTYSYKDGTTVSSQGLEVNPVSNTGMTSNVWHHVVLVYDQSTNIKLYVDGLLVTTSTASAGGTGWTTTDGLRIGDTETYTGSYSSDGRLGFLKIYQGKLSDAQIAQNYLATKNDYPNQYHATNNGATFTYASTPYHFDFVSNDYFRTPSIPITWTSGFAYEIYFKADTNTQSYPISTSGTSNPALSWRNYSGWKLVAFHYKTSSTVDYLESGATSTGQWYHIVYTANDSGGQIYTNGSLSDSTTNSVLTGSYNDYFDIGRLGGGNYFDGKIGMFKIYAKHLSSTEVSANYDATKSTYGLS